MRAHWPVTVGWFAAICVGALLIGAETRAGPAYEFDRYQLESILADMKAWLPGAWDSFPQIWYERTVTMPAEGEHEHWHRTFALIDAPQVGETVFYGQINIGGRDGPIMARTQVLYKAVIDETRDVVVITGQPIAEPERFADLHARPELWREVRMRDESAVNCDFIWRRDGRQLVGVLEGKTPDRRKYGPGTCSYISQSGAEFYADAEWVLTPDELWLYDINKLRDVQFIGRQDRTHIRLYRARPYSCDVVTRTAATGESRQTLAAHDRGYTMAVPDPSRQLLLLRAWYPGADGVGLADELRLMLVKADGPDVLASARARPLAKRIVLQAEGVAATCRRDGG